VDVQVVVLVYNCGGGTGDGTNFRMTLTIDHQWLAVCTEACSWVLQWNQLMANSIAFCLIGRAFVSVSELYLF
jgi:hypothetical protein